MAANCPLRVLEVGEGSLRSSTRRWIGTCLNLTLLLIFHRPHFGHAGLLEHRIFKPACANRIFTVFRTGLVTSSLKLLKCLLKDFLNSWRRHCVGTLRFSSWWVTPSDPISIAASRNLPDFSRSLAIQNTHEHLQDKKRFDVLLQLFHLLVFLALLLRGSALPILPFTLHSLL